MNTPSPAMLASLVSARRAQPQGRSLPASELLAHADRLLTAAASGGPARPRAVALLLRLSLEEWLRRYWQRTRPELARCRTLSQALCLAAYEDRELAGRWSATWLVLSRACHYHGYELPPTVAELRTWYQEVALLTGDPALPPGR